MIYFDNAATTKNKPETTYEAFNYYVREIGTSPGRGSYPLAIQASRMLYKSRKSVAKFFNIDDPSNVVFTKNSTEAINLFLNGYLKKGDHVLISPYEHNAVLRPIQSLKDKGIIDYTVLSNDAIYDAKNYFDSFVKDNTAILVTTLASNLTGQIVFNKDLADQTKKSGIKIFVDASQGAGKKLLDVKRDNIDFLAFTGHKDLLALPGVGGLVSKNELKINPLIQGGTGVHGEKYTNPDIYPDAYESGTINMPAIWSLKNSLEFIEENISTIIKKENEITKYLISELSKIDKVKIYNANYERVSTFCFNIEGVPSNQVVEELGKEGICVRGGIHCAIKAHETIGTVKTGAVRVSLNYFNAFNEADEFITNIRRIANCI